MTWIQRRDELFILVEHFYICGWKLEVRRNNLLFCFRPTRRSPPRRHRTRKGRTLTKWRRGPWTCCLTRRITSPNCRCALPGISFLTSFGTWGKCSSLLAIFNQHLLPHPTPSSPPFHLPCSAYCAMGDARILFWNVRIPGFAVLLVHFFLSGILPFRYCSTDRGMRKTMSILFEEKRA